MKILRGKAVAVVVGLLGLALAGSTEAYAKQEIKIGFINPTTGVFSSLGKYARKGMDLALAQAEKKAAFRGITFKVDERDSAAKTSDAIRYARELVQREHVDVLMGGLSSAVCLALQKFAGEEKITYITASGCWTDAFSSPANVNKYAFRVTANNMQRNVAFADWLVKHVGKRWYVAYSDFAYGQSGNRSFRAAMKKVGGTVVGSVAVPFGTTDMAPYMSKVDTSANGLYFVMAGRDAILALQEAGSEGLNKKMRLAGMQSLIVPENFPTIPAAANGLAFVGDYPRVANGPLDTPENHAFRAAYHAMYPHDVIGLNAFEAYQATNALLGAIEKSGFHGRRDTDKLVDALAGIKFGYSEEFPAGPVRIRASDHQGVAPLYIAVVKGGTEDVVHMIPASTVGKIK